MQRTVKSTRSPWVVLAVLGAVVIAVAAGVFGRQFYRPQAEETPPATPIVAPTTSGAPTSPQQRLPIVLATLDVTRHPNYEPVRQLLQTHFDAINGKHYDRWKTTVTKERISETPQALWQQWYRSTKDDSMLIHRIESSTGGTGLRVLVSFTSRQNVEDAPVDLRETCIQWHITMQLAKQSGGWKLDAPPKESIPPRRERCID